ncbi:hypothetical protein ACPSKX_05150 [Moritella viscosa]
MFSPREVKTVADAKYIIEQRGLSHVKVGLFDADGVMRGKYMSKENSLPSSASMPKRFVPEARYVEY